jgi:hypothetical protein
MGRWGRLLLLAASLLAVTASSGAAARPSRAPILGVVPKTSAPHALANASLAAAGFLTFDTNYESLINRYFADVHTASGGTSNVYSIATQYSDTSGPIQYQSAFAGSYVDNGPLPANGCDDGLDSVCLTDQQLQNEIQRVLAATGWHGSTSTMYFVMTPDGVGSCFDSSSAECTTNAYCAYHSSFTDSSGEPVIYANEPYNATIDGCDVSATGSSPNGDDADPEINTISHEHNEAITDPFGDAWWAEDQYQSENGDLCAWDFGTPIGGNGLGQYNQVINGHHYWLQQEWSNNGSNCFQNSAQEGGPTHANKNLVYHGGAVMHTNTTYAIYWLPAPGNRVLPVLSGTAAVNQTLTTSAGFWTGAPTGFSYQWQRCSSNGTRCASIPGATSSSYRLTTADGGTYVRPAVSASNVNGSSAYVAAAGRVVVPLPSATAAPALSGIAAVGQQLTTTAGSWNTQASFGYQWLRCLADGTGCTTIPGAASATYVAAGVDGGHRLEARVSATNVVGTTQALSSLSAVVIAVPRIATAPRISGRSRVGRRLTATEGTWSGPPQNYLYQWLRCNAHGRACHSIRRATHARYRLTRVDTRHRLRVRVTAFNIAGSGTALSRATRQVSR